MKYILFALILFSPLPALATVKLANCDDTPHTVIIRNSGSERVVTFTRYGGEIEEFGPMWDIAFQIHDKAGNTASTQPVIRPLSQYEEFCIWSGVIKVQRLNTGGNGVGGNAFR